MEQRPETSVPGWFHQELVQAQGALYGYASALMAGSRDTWDVLQNANRVMCEKMSEVATPGDFRPWALTVVRFQVMAHRKRICRERHVFGAEIFEQVAAGAAKLEGAFAERIAALEECLQSLPERQRTYLALRYNDGLAVRDIADRLSRTENVIAAALYRARSTLADCIKLALGKGAAG